METLNVSDALLPSAGPNPALFRVELKKGGCDLVLIYLEVKSMAHRLGKGTFLLISF